MNKQIDNDIMFSVIVPVYNVEGYLKECVDSILNQSYCDYEVILVDDGSTDRSGVICDEYAQCSDKIKVIHKENGGLSSARNAGIDAAKGNYVLFIDSDDFYCDEQCFYKFAQIISEEKPDFLMYKHGKYFGDDSVIDFYGDYDIENIKEDKAAIFQYMVKEHKQLACACNKIVRRALLLEEELYFELGTIGEDICWTVELFEAANKISYINIMPYMYRQSRGGSITSVVTKKKLDDLYAIINNLATRYQNDDRPFGKAVLTFLAYEYAILLFNISKSENQVELCEYSGCSWVLKYAQDRNAKLVSLAVCVLGLKNTVKLLRLRKG